MYEKPKYCKSCRHKENQKVIGIATHVTPIHHGQTCDKCGYYKPTRLEELHGNPKRE